LIILCVNTQQIIMKITCLLVAVFLLHVFQVYSYGGSRYEKGVTRSQHKFRRGSSSGRHEARKSSGFKKKFRDTGRKSSFRDTGKKNSFKKHSKRHRRSSETISIVADATRQGVQDLGTFAQNQIQIIGDDLQMLEQALVRIFTDITDAKLENAANLLLAFSNFLDDEAPESGEQESDDLIEGEDDTTPEREAQKLMKFRTHKKIAQTIAKKIIARVQKIMKTLKNIKGKRSVDSINSFIDATRQGVQDFGGSAESAIQSIGDELQSLKQDLVQISTDIVDSKFNSPFNDDDIIPEVMDDEMPEIDVPEV